MGRYMPRAELNEELVWMLDAAFDDGMVEYIEFDDEEPHLFKAFYYKDIELVEILKFKWDVSEEDYKQSIRNQN